MSTSEQLLDVEDADVPDLAVRALTAHLIGRWQMGAPSCSCATAS
jgi:hypothetical protein